VRRANPSGSAAKGDGSIVLLRGRLANESNTTVDRLIRVLAPNNIHSKYREPPRREFFSRNLNRPQAPPPVADDVTVLRSGANAIIVSSRYKESFVLVVPLPVPQINVPPSPDPRTDCNVHACLFT